MNIFIKCTAIVLITLILYLLLSKQGHDFAYFLSITTCCIILYLTFNYLQSVIDFISYIKDLVELDTEIVGVVLKSVGIGVLAEIVCAFCSDAGNSALGKTLHVIAAFVILFISIPLLEALISLIEEILVTV